MTTHSDGALFLQITRGRTNHPMRPIHGDRFLIGSGEWCDLRLGGSMPVLHSVVRVEGPSVWLEAVVDAPPLHVNGRTVGSCELQDGDQIVIGLFSLQFCDARNVQHESLMQPIDIEEVLALDQPDVELSDLTATELVDLMERDEELAREFQKRQEQGAAALLDRIHQEVKDESTQSSP
ncbi:MAG: FHA domain-containing protein, partial [Planctomycetaceae bacterium]